MSDPSPTPIAPPTGRRLALSAAGALAVAAAVLVLFILPAEYGIDPTGVGGALGLTQMTAPAGRTFEIGDVLGGNENVREVEIPDFGDPVPLPNPAIHQDQAQAARTETRTIVVPAEQETEIKLVLGKSKSVLYSWSVDRGTVYADFHGHDPAAGDEFWVRYKEHQEGNGHHGSLVAPFDGEHGWFWLNYNEFPVEITLTVTGFYDDIIDYGIF